MSERSEGTKVGSTDLLARAEMAITRLLEWTEYVGDGAFRPREVDVAERYARRVQRELRGANDKITGSSGGSDCR